MTRTRVAPAPTTSEDPATKKQSEQYQDNLSRVSSDEHPDDESAQDMDKDNNSSHSSEDSKELPYNFKNENLADSQDSILDALSQDFLHNQNINKEKQTKESQSYSFSVSSNESSEEKISLRSTDSKGLPFNFSENPMDSQCLQQKPKNRTYGNPPHPDRSSLGKFNISSKTQDSSIFASQPGKKKVDGEREIKGLKNPKEDSSSSKNDYLVYEHSLEWQNSALAPERQKFLHDDNPSKRKYKTEPQTSYFSFGMSTFNLANTIMGTGMLGLSFAMANTGIIPFIILLVSFTIFSLYSVHLLLKTADEGDALIYGEIADKAFGMAGKLAASCSITMHNIGAMSTYLFIIKYELPIVIQSLTGARNGEWYIHGDYLVLLVSVILILPLTLPKKLGYLGYTSSLSLLCMVFFLIVVIIKKFQIPCPLPLTDHVNETMQNSSHHSENTTSNDDLCRPKYFIYNSQTVYAIPIITFAFVCHPSLLPIYEELKDRSRSKMQNVANVSFLATSIMYLLAALFGYLTFNINVEPELLHTYSKYFKHDVLLLVVRLAVLAAVTFTVPVVLFPIHTSISHLLFSTREVSWIQHIIITIVLLAGTNTVVIFVPSIRDIFGFIGASASVMLIFILPSAFYIKLVKKESMMSMQKIWATMFLILGFFVMFGCMTLIFMDWISNQ